MLESGIIAELQAIVGRKSVIDKHERLRIYESDGLTNLRALPHQLIRCAIDPDNLSNPNKIYPTPRLCGEAPGPYHPHLLEAAGVIERF